VPLYFIYCTAVELLAEIVQSNALDAKEIDRQKTILLKELEVHWIWW